MLHLVCDDGVGEALAQQTRALLRSVVVRARVRGRLAVRTAEHAAATARAHNGIGRGQPLVAGAAALGSRHGWFGWVRCGHQFLQPCYGTNLIGSQNLV